MPVWPLKTSNLQPAIQVARSALWQCGSQESNATFRVIENSRATTMSVWLAMRWRSFPPGMIDRRSGLPSWLCRAALVLPESVSRIGGLAVAQ
jgi:hypothetical protein